MLFFINPNEVIIHAYIYISMITFTDLIQSGIFRDGCCRQSIKYDIDLMGDLDFDFIHGMMTDDFLGGGETSGYDGGYSGGGATSSSNERQQYDDVFDDDDSNRIAFEHTYKPVSNQSHNQQQLLHQHHQQQQHHHHQQDPIISRVSRNLHHSYLPNRSRIRSSSMSSSSNNYHINMFDPNYSLLASSSSPLVDELHYVGKIKCDCISSIVIQYMLITPIYAYYLSSCTHLSSSILSCRSKSDRQGPSQWWRRRSAQQCLLLLHSIL